MRLLTRRGPDGRPSPVVRLFALLVVVCLLGISAPALIPVARWFLGLF